MRLARALAVAMLFASACDNALVGNTTPVPPVHRVPPEIEGTVVLLAEDAVIESSDPVHIRRAKEARIPQDYRAAMASAFQLAGFKVVTTPSQKHELVAHLALAVREEPRKVYQTYRCHLTAPDGAEVAQIDWAWPQGVYSDETEVLNFATHNVATEIATSRRVVSYLQSARAAPAPPPPVP